MKKIFSNFCTLAALLMAGAAFTACSSSDDITTETKQPVNPTGKYTLTINASKGNAGTRALDFEDGKLVASWDDDDIIYVTKGETPVGTMEVTSISYDGTATLTGELSGVDVNDGLTLTYHPIASIKSFGNQTGLLKGTKGAEEFDVATATVTVAGFDGSDITIDDDIVDFETRTSLAKFYLTDGTDPINATNMRVDASVTITGLPYIGSYTFNETLIEDLVLNPSIYTTNGAGVIYFALPGVDELSAAFAEKINKELTEMSIEYSVNASQIKPLLINSSTLTFTATAGDDAYTVEKAGYNFVAGKYYKNVTLEMAKPVVDISKLDGDYVAKNGDILTGTLNGEDGSYKISIADGATVTLNGVTINGVSEEYDNSTHHAGITCEGDATIILADETTNTVKGFFDIYPGIFIAEGHTLTIKGENLGTGKLIASSNGKGAGIGGFGTPEDLFKSEIRNCGHIVIQGGDITATGGDGAAGIGSGNGAVCGDITISGGKVVATGGNHAAAIGSGHSQSCGNITITSDVTRVDATADDNLPKPIGAGLEGSCGTVTIDGIEVTSMYGNSFAHFNSLVSTNAAGRTWSLVHP